MFETSHVTARVAAQRRYGLLTVSLAVHTAVVAAVLVASVSSLTLPTRAPNELPMFSSFVPVVIPPPLGTRTVPRTTAATPAQPPATRTAPQEVTAPERIPETIAPVGPATGDLVSPGGDSAAVPYGDPNGVPGGVDTGVPQPATTVTPPDVVYHPGGEVHNPVVLRRVEPLYPRAALTSRLSGVVVLGCIVDKEGRIRDAHVVRSTMAIFDQPALDALQQWRFTPGMFRGQPVDTWFELTVAFQPR
jgi:protein TonB